MTRIFMRNRAGSAALNGLVMIMQITEKCNLACGYCYLRKKKPIDMRLDTAYAAVDFANQLVRKKYYKNVTLCFHGGEPTLVFDLVKKIVGYAKRGGLIDKFIIGTNGVCLDESKVRFMAKNCFSPTISLDGISAVQNANRPFIDGSGSWKKVDASLDALGRYSRYWKDKRVPDPLRVRISVTPQTLPYLFRSVRYIAQKKIGAVAAINVMPVIQKNNQWQAYYRQGSLLPQLKAQMQDMAEFYLERKRSGKPFIFCINECLTPDWSSLCNPIGISATPFCGAGGLKIIAVSMEGDIFPCYLHAANPKEHPAFRMGNVFSGIDKFKSAVDFCGNKKNKHFSCLFWNRQENGDPDKPALIYSLFYNAWRDAVMYIKRNNRYEG